MLTVGVSWFLDLTDNNHGDIDANCLDAVGRLSCNHAADEDHLAIFGKTPDYTKPPGTGFFYSQLEKTLLDMKVNPVLPLLDNRTVIFELLGDHDFRRKDGPKVILQKDLSELIVL